MPFHGSKETHCDVDPSKIRDPFPPMIQRVLQIVYGTRPLGSLYILHHVFVHITPCIKYQL